MLSIEQREPGIVVIAGRLDAAESPSAQAFLDRITGTVILDCTGLDYISSAGLGVLLKTQKRLLGASGGLRLRGLKPHIVDVFTYSGFDRIFEIDAGR